MGVPILLIGFNRPDLLEKNLKSIADYKPKQLFIFVDGPREDVPGDRELVDRSRRIARGTPWAECVTTFFPEQNLGVKYGPSEAISWFFSQVESGVILEDDCLASRGFFAFAEQFLVAYEGSDDVWGFSGSNPKHFASEAETGHFFMRHPHTWGWGTWADRWEHIDIELETFKSAKASGSVTWPSDSHRLAFARHLESIARTGFPVTWDFQWAWTVMAANGLWAISSAHLVKNVGFREDATHTSRPVYAESEYGTEIRLEKQENPQPDFAWEESMLRTFHGLRSPKWLASSENMMKRAFAWLRARLA